MKQGRSVRLAAAAAAACLLLSWLLVLAEAPAETATIRSLPAALWYMLTTLTTVGYGDLYPVTAAGRVIGAVFQLCSIGLLAAMFGIVLSAVRGRLLPGLRLRLRLRLRRGKDWYVFTAAEPAALALAGALQREDPRRLILFAGRRGGGRLPAGMAADMDVAEILRLKGRRGAVHLFCMERDYGKNEAAAHQYAGEGRWIYCLSEYEPEHLSSREIRFSPAACCARLYWSRYPVRSPEERIVLIGGGKYAEALLEQALQQNVLDDPQQIEYRVYGDFTDFRRDHPALAQFCADAPGAGRDCLLFSDAAWNDDPQALQQADRIIFCGDSEQETVERLIRLRKYWPVSGTVYARLPAPFAGAVTFGSEAEIFTPELVKRAGLSRLAMRLHEIYRAGAGGAAPDWSALSFTRRSNLASADHLETKIRILLGDGESGLSRERCARAYQALCGADAGQRERLRRIEHARWMRFHLLCNWQYDPVRDDARRRHPLLRPYEELTEADQRKDDYAWELLGLLAAAPAPEARVR